MPTLSTLVTDMKIPSILNGTFPKPPRQYVEFREVPKGATFGDSWQWVKRSTRTAYHVESERVFYFRQRDIVRC